MPFLIYSEIFLYCCREDTGPSFTSWFSGLPPVYSLAISVSCFYMVSFSSAGMRRREKAVQVCPEFRKMLLKHRWIGSV